MDVSAAAADDVDFSEKQTNKQKGHWVWWLYDIYI